MDEYEKAVAELRSNHLSFVSAGPRSEALIEWAERTLGFRFPPSLRRFVRDFGAGDLGGVEICGVTTEISENDAVPNGVWLTLDERRNGLPLDLFVVGEDALGGLVTVQAAGEGREGPVELVEPGPSRAHAKRRIVAPSFGAYLLSVVRDAIAHPPDEE
jgi:hypothetical protein